MLTLSDYSAHFIGEEHENIFNSRWYENDIQYMHFYVEEFNHYISIKFSTYLSGNSSKCFARNFRRSCIKNHIMLRNNDTCFLFTKKDLKRLQSVVQEMCGTKMKKKIFDNVSKHS